MVNDVGSVGDNDFGVVKLRKKNSWIIYGVEFGHDQIKGWF